MIKYPSKDSIPDYGEFNDDNEIVIPSLPSRASTPKEDSFNAETYLFPIDESEEFLDPFSDLSLFLAKRVKRELLKEKNPKKWSHKIQNLLLREILPDFSKKFPRYRLGNTALKKTWEKVGYYLRTIQQEQGALYPNGKLNVDFIIKRNLGQLVNHGTNHTFHPYNSAHSLAVKISECIATHDGVRPAIDELTKTIWAVQKHLVIKKPQETTSSFEKYDQLDKLIVRFQLEEIAKHPEISKQELSNAIERKIGNLKQLQRIRNIEDLTASISAILANELYPTLKLHKSLSKESLNAIISFVQKQVSKCQSILPIFGQKERIQLTSRIIFLYKLARHIPPSQIEQSLNAAIKYVYSLSTDTFSPQGPVLRQEVYTFIDSEISLHKELKTPNPLKAILDTLIEVFHQISSLPMIPDDKQDELEIVIWKVMHDHCDLVGKVPNYLRDTISEELSNIHIDHAKNPFQHIIQTTIHYLRKVREIDIETLSAKLHFWSLQNDMIAHWLHFDNQDPLLKLIKRTWRAENLDEYTVAHDAFIEKVLAIHLKSNPSLKGWRTTLKNRITIMYKYFWYTDLSGDSETSFDRFLKWHYNALHNSDQKQFSEILLNHLENTSERLAPLTPFNREYARTLLKGFTTIAC